jgi:hypothetical protein
MTQLTLNLENNALLAFKRLPYKPWYAIAEFVDNSTDAYFRKENRKALDEAFKNAKPGDDKLLRVSVVHDKDARLLRISDNSMGMNADELTAAFRVGNPPAVTAGRSEFGMGMKTASVWFGNSIHIKTKRLGDPHELSVTVNFQDFIQGSPDFEITTSARAKDLHYTVVELRDIERRIGPSALDKVRQFLGSMYRSDLRAGLIEIDVNGTEVVPPPSRNDEVFLKRADNSPYVVPVDIAIDGGEGQKRVIGWVGVLGPSYASRSAAGFALIRHGRTIHGWVDAWRPDEIFGEARNDLKNQRIAGELEVDGFGVSHTKDTIDWSGDEEENLGKELKRICGEYDLLRVAQKTRYRDEVDLDGRVLTSADRDAARAALEEQMSAPEMVDRITLLEVPTPAQAKLAAEPLLNQTGDTSPFVTFQIGESRKASVFLVDVSPNDPYYEYEVLESADLKVSVNTQHPAFLAFTQAEGLLIHLQHVVFDAVAEWKCAQMHQAVQPGSIRLMKDGLFRASAHAGLES